MATLSITRATLHILRTTEEEEEWAWVLRRAEFKLALEGLSRPAQQYVRALAHKDHDERGMARVLAPGYHLAYTRRVAGRLAPEFKAWRTRVRQLLAAGQLPRLRAQLRAFGRHRPDELPARVVGWSLEELDPEARAVLRNVLRPPVKLLDLGIVLRPGFPFSMFGASAATILQLEAWQRSLQHQGDLDHIGPCTRQIMDRWLGPQTEAPNCA